MKTIKSTLAYVVMVITLMLLYFLADNAFELTSRQLTMGLILTVFGTGVSTCLYKLK